MGSRHIDYIKKIFKLIAQGFGFAAGIASLFAIFLALYGTEETKAVFKTILNDVYTNNTVLKASLWITLLIVIIAAFICTLYIIKTKQSLSREYDNNNNGLKRITNLLEQERNLGILAINLRNSSNYSADAYKKIFKRTCEELIISGHSLNKTINKKKSDDLRNEFMATIIRLIEKEHEVKILLMKTNENPQRIEKRKEFTIFIKELYEKLSTKKIKNDIISRNLLVKETEFLPYYIVKNEDKFHIAHYVFGEYSDYSDGKMYIFEVSEHFGYGKYCYDDFNSFFSSKAEFIMEYRDLFEGKSDA